MSLRPRTAPRVYEIGHRVAVGGMGEIYEGYARDLDRKVAIKRVLRSNDVPDLKELFVREVSVAAMLEHPNVVEVIDAGAHGPDLYLVMEFVDGPSLAEVLEAVRRRRKILPIELTCGIIAPIARGLAHAHARSLPDGTSLGIVHRDIAPENILITKAGVPKVADFGLARLAGHDFTSPGTIRGRPRCLSPEQARGEKIDLRSDVFALGAMLFEMVSGQGLYPNEALATLLFRVAAGEYEPIAKRLPHADPDLIAILETALAVDPADRYRSARELERALDSFRAARGLRADSNTIARLLTDLGVEILRVRAEKREENPGELEGQKLALTADRFDTAAGDFAAAVQFAETPTADLVPQGLPPRREVLGETSDDVHVPAGLRSFDSPRAHRLVAEEVLDPSGPFAVPPPSVSVGSGQPRAQPLQPWSARPVRTSDLDSGPLDPEPAPAFVSALPGSAELPKPEAPAKVLGHDGGLLSGRTELGWTVFLGLVLLAATLAFVGVWSRAPGLATGPGDRPQAQGVLVLPSEGE